MTSNIFQALRDHRSAVQVMEARRVHDTSEADPTAIRNGSHVIVQTGAERLSEKFLPSDQATVSVAAA